MTISTYGGKVETSKLEIQVNALEPQHLEETLEVLLAAFDREAFTKAWLDLSQKRIRDAYKTAGKLKFRLHLEAGHPAFVAIEGGIIVGLILITLPNKKGRLLTTVKYSLPHLPQLMFLLPSLFKGARLSLAAKPPRAMLPSEYCTIEAVAVAPLHQGKKIGRKLLEHAQQYCFYSTQTESIYLYTGDQKNKDIYEHLGYRLLEARNTDGFISYHLLLTKS